MGNVKKGKRRTGLSSSVHLTFTSSPFFHPGYPAPVGISCCKIIFYSRLSATFEDFARDAARGNVVPCANRARGLANARRRISARKRRCRLRRPAGILEGGERVARTHSWARTRMAARRGDKMVIEIRGEEIPEREISAVDFLLEHFISRSLPPRGLVPLAVGVVAISPTCCAMVDPVSRSRERDLQTRLTCRVMFYRTRLAFDRVRPQMLSTSVVFTGSRAAAYDCASFMTARLKRRKGSNSFCSPLRPRTTAVRARAQTALHHFNQTGRGANSRRQCAP